MKIKHLIAIKKSKMIGLFFNLQIEIDKTL